jgi:hypothetical protein
MAVHVRPYKKAGFEVDVRIKHPDGTEIRDRKKIKLSSKSAQISQAKVVEAAGVEPASESTSSWDSTCVSASEISCSA